jgi:peptide deformylase
MLLMKDIIREGHPTLAQRSSEVSLPLNNKTKKILKEMMEFLENSQDPEISEELGIRPGVGLAAPQINVKLRMIAIFTTDEKNEKLYKMLLVNPKIISHSEARTYILGGEGCLSVDREVEGLVPRHKKVTVRAHQYLPETDELKKIELRVSGYVSVVLQHEIDHINGILFVDKLVDNLDDVEPVQFIVEEEIKENMEEAK